MYKVLVISNENPAEVGGVQRVAKLIAEYWSTLCVDLDIIYKGKAPKHSSYNLVHSVGFSNSYLYSTLKRLHSDKLYLTPAWHPFRMHRRPLSAWLYFHLISKTFYKKANGIHCLSEVERSFFKKITRGNSKKFALPLKNTFNNIRPIKKDIDVLFVGRADKLKGIDVFSSCVEKNPDFSFYAVIPHKQKFFKSSDNLKIVYNVTDKKLFELYCRSKVLIQPSAWESFGLAIIEAYFCNCEILCSSNVMGLEWIKGKGIHKVAYKATKLEWSEKLKNIMSDMHSKTTETDIDDLKLFSKSEFYKNLSNFYEDN